MYFLYILALFGLMEKNYEKVKKNKGFLHLKKRICRELADIFNNTSNNDPHQLDTVKSYAIFLLHLFVVFYYICFELTWWLTMHLVVLVEAEAEAGAFLHFY